MSVMTVSTKYRHENQNSIYYLKPGTNDLFLLDFKVRGFCKEQCKWSKNAHARAFPREVTSVQTTDANIYLVGGYRTSPSAGEMLPLRDLLQIDANLNVYERESMKSARFCAPVALVRDRFILALGGRTGKNTTTKTCEAYDTYTNIWFNIASMPISIVNASAVVMSERFVYLMPG